MKVFKRFVLTAFSLSALLTGTAQANVISQDFSGLGEQNSPGSISWNFNTTGGAATLGFELEGYASLDGYWNCCSDIFHLYVNATEVFTGSFNLGGGGWNAILFNPYGATANTTTFGASDDPHNSSQVTWAGGVSQISLPISLITGSNTITFAYSGAGQGLGDEGWGINTARISMSSVAEPAPLTLLSLGLIGLVAVRRRQTN